MEVLLRRHILWCASASTFLDCGEKLANLLLGELGSPQDQDNLIVRWVASEAPQQPDCLRLGILVENARQCELANV